jgi:hypothetical protein
MPITKDTPEVLEQLDALLALEPYPHSLEEIGDVMGITRERVRQIQAVALRKLRRECIRQGIHWSDFCDVVGIWDTGDQAKTRYNTKKREEYRWKHDGLKRLGLYRVVT